MRGVVVMAALVVLAGCGGAVPGTDDALTGTVVVDGSSTVFPLTEAVAEEFQRAHPGVRVTVGMSGTGGGFKKFCAAETDVSNASRPMKPEEAELCAAAGVEPVGLPVAIDALAVVVHPSNDWIPADCITVDQLRAIWDQGSTARTWSDVDASWPATEIQLYSPGHDSGTFDYFTEAINGSSQRSRTDGVLFSEDDNVLVQGVAGDRGAIGYFGIAYYAENAARLKALAVDAGEGCREPTREQIERDTYKPLGRPVFIYPSVQAAARPEVGAFLEFYLDHVDVLAADVGYYPLPAAQLERSRRALAEALGR